MRLLCAAHTAVTFVALLKKSMEIGKMNGIDVAFVGLQIIALVENLAYVKMIGRRIEKIIIGDERRLSRSHVGEDRPRDFFARIGAMANLVAMLAATGLAGLFETTSVNIVEPAVIETAQTAVFDPPIAKIRAAMRAVQT